MFQVKNAEDDPNDLIALKLKLKQQLEHKLFEKTPSSRDAEKAATKQTAANTSATNSSHHDSHDDENNHSSLSNLSSLTDSNDKETTRKESSHLKHHEKKRKKESKKQQSKSHHHHHHHHNEKKASAKKKQQEEDELLVRRSARIQIIEVQKQYTKEQQIAEKIKKHANNSNNSLSCQQEFLNDQNSNNSESQPALMSSSHDLFAENDLQPAKIKDRWRRFSEKENDSTEGSASAAAHSLSMQDLTMSPRYCSLI